MILKIEEKGQTAILSASTNTVVYPVSNIVNSLLSRVYRTDAVLTLEIVFDLMVASEINSINIANHNFTSSAIDLKLQANSTNAWGAPAFEVNLAWNDKIIVLDFPSEIYRFWRIVVDDPTNVLGYLQIGRAWLGVGYDELGIKFLVDQERKSASSKTITPSGNSYMDKRYFYWLIKIKIPKITDIQHAKLIELFEIADIGIPFFVTFDKAGKILETQYVTYDFEGLKLTPLGKRDLFSTSMNFIQEVIG